MNGMPMGNVLQKENLYEQVANLLEQEILMNYEDGKKLPSEQHLAEQYEVSRTIIREALKLLKERGLIDSKTGSGSYVTKPEAQNIADVVHRIIQTDHIDYENVSDMRIILELESVGRAARYATEEELEEMMHLLEHIKNPNNSNDERSEYDFAFHYQIAKASRNPLLALMIEAIGTVCREMISNSFRLCSSLEDSIKRHNLIMEALKSRDEEAARDAMRAHLEKSKRNYGEYLKEKGM